MIQDILPHVYKNSFETALPAKGDQLIVECGGEILVKETVAGFELPLCGEDEPASFLFRLDGRPFFLKSAPAKETLGGYEGFSFKPRKYFRHASPKHLAFAAVNAMQLAGWYKMNRFCGRCGKETVPSTKERMLECPNCGAMIYPRISPAVIIGITSGDRILLTKYRNGPTKNYALVAGFNEIGETLEETVRRETMEEVGLKVKNLRYYKSQPWPFTDSLLAGFYCELDGEAGIMLQESELSYGGWFKRSEIPVEWNDLSLTNEMITHFKTHPEEFA